jgi:hypothetical protein
MAGELLGEATLELDVDLTPLDRGLAEGERRAALGVASMQATLDRGMGQYSQRLGMLGTAYDQQLTPPVQRFGAAVDRMGKQVDGSLEQTRIEQAATARELQRTAAIAGVAATMQENAAERAAKAYAEQAAAARASADAQEAAAHRATSAAIGATTGSPRPEPVPPDSILSESAVAERLATAAEKTWAQRAWGPSFNENSKTGERSGASAVTDSIWGVRGPKAAGSVGNPVVMVMEAASRTGLGSLAAAVGESPVDRGSVTTVATPGGGAAPTVVSSGSGSGAGPTVISGGGNGGGRPPIALGGGDGGGGGGGLRNLLLGGGSAIPFLGAAAGAGSLGSFAGFGAEHIITTLIGLAGSAAGGVAGGSLLGLGMLGKAGVGLGSDAAVMSSTIADTKALGQAYGKVQEAVEKYGAGSKQAAMAQHELNMLMGELGNTSGVKAELGLAKQAEALNTFWDKATSNARIQAVGILSQVVMLGTSFVPKVAQAAEMNLAVINTGIKPLFAWLQGPQGMSIWNDLENMFRQGLPNAIQAGTQGVEFFLRLTDIAARYTGGFTTSLDHLFTRLNSLDNAQINQWVGKMIYDFDIWKNLIKVVGEDIYYLFHADVGTASGIVVGITHALERLREWEKSTKGSAQLQSIFMVHKEEIKALGALIGPLASSFGHLYLAIAPTLVPAVTELLGLMKPVLDDLAFVAGHSEAAALALGGLFIAVKAFGTAAVWSGLRSGIGWLIGAETASAGAATADAAAQATLAEAEAAAGGAGAASGAGSALSGAGSLAGVGGLARLGARAGGAVEGGSLGIAGVLESLGLGGLALKVAGAGGVLGKVATVAAPALLAGGAGYLAGNFASNALGVHGVGKGAIEGATTGAAAGAVVGGPLGALVGGVGGAGVGALLAALAGGGPVLEIKNLGTVSKESTSQLGKLIDQLKHVSAVKVEGISEPIKQVREQLERAKRAAESWNHAFDKPWSAIHGFAVGAGPVLKELFDRFDTNFKLIAHTMGLNSATGRKLAEENVAQMVSHITKAVHDGQLPVGAGMSAISNVIAKYAKATGDQTPKVYEQMFSQIATLEKNHEIGTKTAFHAYTTIAGKESDLLSGVVVTRRREMFAHLKTEFDNGEITEAQYHAKVRARNKVTAGEVESAMGGMTASIVESMEQGALSTKDGGDIIFKNLNSLLKKFGAPELSAPQVAAYAGAYKGIGRSNRSAGFGGSTAGESGGGGTNSGPNGNHAAQGALYQIGAPGDRGHDTIPMSIGGTDVMVGSGEVAAVLNADQQAVANRELAHMGGLAGLFATYNKPHYLASGGIVKGYSQGGAISYGGLEGLWDRAGGASSLAPLMAAIAEAESGGSPIAHNPSGASGLWQILGLPFPGNPFDPLTNARMAVAKYKSQGLRAWETYTNGSYRQFLHGNVPPNAEGGGAGGAGSLHSPIVRGVGALAGIARAALRQATGAANAYLGKVQPAAGSSSASVGPAGSAPSGGGFSASQLSTFEGVTVAKWIIPELTYARAHGWRGPVTSGYRAGFDPHAPSGSMHALDIYPGGAVDFGGMVDPAGLANRAAFIAATRGYPGKKLLTPIGFRDDGHMSGTGHARGGVLRMAGGGMLAHTATISKPKGVQHVKRPTKAPKATLRPLISSLGAIPGMEGITQQLGEPEGAYNLLVDEQSLLGNMTSNPASILASDMPYLAPTIMPGQHIGTGMLVPPAEREQQRALQAHGESPGLSLQASLLQWIGGLDDHRLLNAQDIGVLAKDFIGHAGKATIHGVGLAAGAGVFVAQQAVLEAQKRAQETLVLIMRHEKDKAARFVKLRKHRKERLEHLLKVTFQRYRNLKRHLERLRSQGLHHRISQAEAQHAAQQQSYDARVQHAALSEAISSEKALPPWEQNYGLTRAWEHERAHLAASMSTPPSTAAISNAREALMRNELQTELTSLGSSMKALGGSSTEISAGGEIGTASKQITSLQTGMTGLGGKITESVGSVIPQLALSISQIRGQLAEAAESVAPSKIPGTTEPGQIESERVALMKTQNEQLSLQLAVSQAQYKVLANLPPFAGKFHTGGVVPGPTGAERMALVQAGEVISQPGAHPHVGVYVDDAMSWLKPYIRTQVQEGTRGSARSAGRRLPSTGGGLGQ